MYFILSLCLGGLITASSALILPEIALPVNRTTTRPINCYPVQSTAPRIIALGDCGIAIHELIAMSPRAADHVRWGPGIYPAQAWTWGSCGVLLIPDGIQSSDAFSRLEMAEEARTIVTGCVNPVHQYKGGWTTFGPKGVFRLVVKGRPAPTDF